MALHVWKQSTMAKDFIITRTKLASGLISEPGCRSLRNSFRLGRRLRLWRWLVVTVASWSTCKARWLRSISIRGSSFGQVTLICPSIPIGTAFDMATMTGLHGSNHIQQEKAHSSSEYVALLDKDEAEAHHWTYSKGQKNGSLHLIDLHLRMACTLRWK